jgi:hypothetical protein
MTLVSVDEAISYMNDVSFNASQESVVEMVLSGVQQQLELYLGRPVENVQMREMVAADQSGQVFLSVTPVQQILSVGLFDGTPFDPTEIDRPDMEDVADIERSVDRLPSNTMIVPGGIQGLLPYHRYSIEYIGGYQGYTNDAMKIAIIEVAARKLTTHHDDSLSLKDDIANQPAGASMVERNWLPNELDMFHRLKRRVIV